jgi:hypothetical protein
MIQEAVEDSSEPTVRLTAKEFHWLIIAAQIGANERRASAYRKQARMLDTLERGADPATLDLFESAIAEAFDESEAYWRLITKVLGH